MIILSMDVGLINMGLVLAQINVEDFSINRIIDCKQIDIRALVDYCNDKECPHQHSKCIADYMSHLFDKYSNYFNQADVIIIERQPPQGFVSIQEITNFHFRNKVTMIAPQEMHKHFGMQGMSYERRKEFTVEYARRWLDTFEDFSFDRNHDISDAMCMIIYYLWVLTENELLEKQAKEIAPAIAEFEQYRYIP